MFDWQLLAGGGAIIVVALLIAYFGIWLAIKE